MNVAEINLSFIMPRSSVSLGTAQLSGILAY